MQYISNRCPFVVYVSDGTDPDTVSDIFPQCAVVAVNDHPINGATVFILTPESDTISVGAISGLGDMYLWCGGNRVKVTETYSSASSFPRACFDSIEISS